MPKEKKTKSKILIIDDEQILRSLLKEVLKEEGFIVNTAPDGFKGIKSNDFNNPDLIILDLKMPGIDGIETLKKIRKTDKEVLVIILTGYGSAQTIREAQELDVYEYVGKPFRNEVMVNVIKEALSSKRRKKNA